MGHPPLGYCSCYCCFGCVDVVVGFVDVVGFDSVAFPIVVVFVFVVIVVVIVVFVVTLSSF